LACSGWLESVGARRPPLSCRTSPPQGGRSDGRSTFANQQRGRLAKAVMTANLPACGGDVRQDRGGRERSPRQPQTTRSPGPLGGGRGARRLLLVSLSCPKTLRLLEEKHREACALRSAGEGEARPGG